MVAVIGLPTALFTLWQLGPTGAAPLTAPWLVYSLAVIYLRLTREREPTLKALEPS